MKIGRVKAHSLANVPVQPPPFRAVPASADMLLLEVETSDDIVGWSAAGRAHPVMVEFIKRVAAPALVGEDPFRIARIRKKLQANFAERHLGWVFTSALSALDIALWDIQGKAVGLPVHHLLGGAADKAGVYITHGAAYGTAPAYSIEELVAEAEHLVKLGNRHLKYTVGRQAIPDPAADYTRMKAVREAVGPNVTLAMDGNTLMSVPEALRLCKLTEELDIRFLEEPVYENDPRLLADLRSKTTIPIAAAQNYKFSARDLLLMDAVDILQPNANNNGGYTGASQIAALAAAFNKPIGHGNGSGPYNIALQAGLPNGQIVEYHYHAWMAYNAIFTEVPQPDNGYVTPSAKPGTGLEPKSGLVLEYKVEE